MILAALSLALVIGGMAWWAHPGGPGGSILPVAQTSSDHAPSPRWTQAPVTKVSPRHPARLPAGRPTRVVIDRIGVDVPVVPVAAEGNTLTPPSNPQELGVVVCRRTSG